MAYCPQCNAEYRPGILKCADCDVELQPDSSVRDLVVVVTADHTQAARQALQAAGIGTRTLTLPGGEEERPIEVKLSSLRLRDAWEVLHAFLGMKVPDPAIPEWVCLTDSTDSDLILVFSAEEAPAVRQALQNGGLVTRGTSLRREDRNPIELRLTDTRLLDSWAVLKRFRAQGVPDSALPNWVRIYRGSVQQADALRAALDAAGIPAAEPDEDVNTIDPLERATADVLVPEEDVEAAREVMKGLDRIEGE